MTDYGLMAEQLFYCLVSMAVVVLMMSPALIYTMAADKEGDDE